MERRMRVTRPLTEQTRPAGARSLVGVFARRVAGVALCLCAVSGPPGAGVAAQHAGPETGRADGFGALRLPPSTPLIVGLRGGPELSGALVSVVPGALVLELNGGERRTVPLDMVTAVWRRGDRLRNGALIGGVVGLAGGLLGQSGCTGCGRERAVGVLVGVPFWAGIGAWIDARHTGRTLVYRATEPQPGR